MKKKILSCLVCLIIVAILALTGIMIYSKSNHNADDNNKELYFNSHVLAVAEYTSKFYGVEANTYGDVTEYTDIFAYFAAMEDLNIELEFKGYSISKDDPEYAYGKYALTNGEVKQFISAMIGSKAEVSDNGFGLSFDITKMYITYRLNGALQKVTLSHEFWALLNGNEVTDGNVFKIIDSNLSSYSGESIIVSKVQNEFIDNMVKKLKSTASVASVPLYNLSNIKNVEIEVPKANVSDPEMEVKTLDSDDEIKKILSSLDNPVRIDSSIGNVGLVGNCTISINYNDNSSTKIMVLNNGNVLVNLSAGTESGEYVEYTVNNRNLKDTLISKYQTKVNYYDLTNIKDVKIEVKDLKSLDGPVMIQKTLTDKSEIKAILANLDSAIYVEKMPYSVGFIGNTVIEINYNGDPTTRIILLDDGNIAMNLSVGAGESGYAIYTINNKNLSQELVTKYQNK